MGLFTKKEPVKQTSLQPETSTAPAVQPQAALEEGPVFAPMNTAADPLSQGKAIDILASLPLNLTVIPEGEVFTGDFVTNGPIVVGGSVNGNIRTSADVYISQSGKCKGSIYAKNLFSEGNVESDAMVENTVHLSKTSVFDGSLSATNLDTEHGSLFSGNLSLKNRASAPTAKAMAEKSDAATAGIAMK